MQVIGVAFNDNAPMLVPQFVQQFRANFPVGYSDRGRVHAYMQQSIMAPGYVPFLMFIDRNWNIRAQFTGEQDFFRNEEKNVRQMVETLLKEPGPKKRAGAARKK